MVWLHVPHILSMSSDICTSYLWHISATRPSGKDCEHDFHIRDTCTCTTWILHTNGKSNSNLNVRRLKSFFFLKSGCIYNLNFFSKIKETNLAGNRNSKFTSKNHGFFFSFVMKSKLCLTRNDKKKVDYQVQVQCIYQNIGGEGVGYCKVKKKEKLQNRLPLDQNYCPLIYTCLIYLISWTIYYFYDIIGLIVQVKPHTNMVKYYFPTEK